MAGGLSAAAKSPEAEHGSTRRQVSNGDPWPSARPHSHVCLGDAGSCLKLKGQSSCRVTEYICISKNSDKWQGRI